MVGDLHIISLFGGAPVDTFTFSGGPKLIGEPTVECGLRLTNRRVTFWLKGRAFGKECWNKVLISWFICISHQFLSISQGLEVLKVTIRVPYCNTIESIHWHKLANLSNCWKKWSRIKLWYVVWLNHKYYIKNSRFV